MKRLSGHFQETRETLGLVDKYQWEKNCSMDIKYVRIMLYGIKEPVTVLVLRRTGKAVLFGCMFSHHAGDGLSP